MSESKYLQFTINGDSVSVSGKTFHVRNELRTLGGTWDPRRSVWTIPLSVYSGTLKADLISTVTEGMAKEKGLKEDTTKKNRILSALAEKAVTGKYHWICCENCDVMDWSRGITCCRAHGSDGYSVRVYGKLYTGD
jgi:hypothetical protein